MYLEDIVSSTALSNGTDYSYQLRVQRSQYTTAAQNHVSGSDLFLIDSADNQLIEPGDDFGFSVDFSDR